ncbi:MAG: hypothetical protein ABW321_31655 [Polyangiales bacterium]
MVEPRVITVTPTHGIGVWHNVVITNVQGVMDAVSVRGIADAYIRLLDAHPNGIAGITVLRASLKVGSMDTNSEAQKAMAELRSKLLHVSVVIENQGMLAQLLRTVIRTLNSVARGTRLSIAANVDEAARAVVPHVVTPTAESKAQLQRELRDAVETLRAKLPPVEANAS